MTNSFTWQDRQREVADIVKSVSEFMAQKAELYEAGETLAFRLDDLKQKIDGLFDGPSSSSSDLGIMCSDLLPLMRALAAELDRSEGCLLYGPVDSLIGTCKGIMPS